jgi:toxin ParE1/3/4
MRRLLLTRLAERDLIDIWAYTRERWDAVQADKYLDALDRAIHRLPANPELGVRRDYVRKGYRVFFVHRHAVYYAATSSAIRIIRVLHGQMDPSSHL